MSSEGMRADASTVEGLLSHVSEQFRQHGSVGPAVAFMGTSDPRTGAELGAPVGMSLTIGRRQQKDRNWRRAMVEKAIQCANACDAFLVAFIVSGGERAKGDGMEEHAPCVLVFGTYDAEMFAYRAEVTAGVLGPFEDVTATHGVERFIYQASHLSLPRSELVSRSPRELEEHRLALMKDACARVLRGDVDRPYASILANLDRTTGSWRRHEIRLEPAGDEEGWRAAFIAEVSEATIFSRSDAGFVVDVCGPDAQGALRTESTPCIIVTEFIPNRELRCFRAAIQSLDDGLRIGPFYPWDVDGSGQSQMWAI